MVQDFRPTMYHTFLQDSNGNSFHDGFWSQNQLTSLYMWATYLYFFKNVKENNVKIVLFTQIITKYIPPLFVRTEPETKDIKIPF